MSDSRRKHRDSVSIRVSSKVNIGKHRSPQITISTKTKSTRSLGLTSTEGLGAHGQPIEIARLGKLKAKQLTNILSDRIAQIKKKKRYTAKNLIDFAEDLDAISDEPNNHENNAKIIKEYARLILDKNKKLSKQQIKAIALLTGVPDEENNFLHQDNDLAFPNFNKGIIIAQLIARIIEPRLVRQRQEGVCGVAAFMHTLIKQDPEAYVKYIMELALDGSARLNLTSRKSQRSLKTKIESNTKNRPSSHSLRLHDSETEYLDEADFIPLIGFREHANKIFAFSKRAPEFMKALFGVSMYGEVKKWLKKAGYTDIKSIRLKKEADINQLEENLKDGCSSIFLTTSYLAEYLVYDEDQEKYPDYITQILKAGHYIQINGIHYNKKTNEVKLSVITWGEEVTDVAISHDLFKKIKGQSKILVCSSPKMQQHLIDQAEAESVREHNRLNPIIYIEELKSKIENLKKQVNKINQGELGQVNTLINAAEKIIKQTKRHENGLTWIQGAKALQDLIFEFNQGSGIKNDVTAIQPIILFALNNIICPKKKSYELFEKSTNNPKDFTPEEGLIANLRYDKDFKSLIHLLHICKHKKALEKCDAIIKEATNPVSGWMNNYEKNIAEQARALTEVIVQKQQRSQENKKSASKLKETLTDSAKSNNNELTDIRKRIIKLSDNMDRRIRSLIQLAGNSELPIEVLDDVQDFAEKFETQMEKFYNRNNPPLSECQDMLDTLKLNSEILDAKQKKITNQLDMIDKARSSVTLHLNSPQNFGKKSL